MKTARKTTSKCGITPVFPLCSIGRARRIGIRVATEEDLARAVETAAREKDKLVLIEACLPNRDASAGLERLGNAYRQAQSTNDSWHKGQAAHELS
jgi:hypothetical protein